MIRKIIASDPNLITYRPALREIGGSIAGTVLLQQIIYWDEKSGGKFYKFSEPCVNHDQYKVGDSWSEELGMSAKELRTALHHFAFKCGTKNKSKFGVEYDSKRASAVVQYYTDSKRVTWYVLNRDVLSKLLLGIYKESDEVEFTNLLTETTTETTYIKDRSAKASSPVSLETNKKPNAVGKQVAQQKPTTKKKSVPPSAEDVKAWAVAWAKKKGKDEKVVQAQAIKAFEYYTNLDWKDSRGVKVKSWKHKIVAVWFTDERLGTKTEGCKEYGGITL